MLRALALLVVLGGMGLSTGCHNDHDDHDRDRHTRWDRDRDYRDRDYRRDEVIVVPARGEDIRYRDGTWRRDRY